jgi:hypothetical protein
MKIKILTTIILNILCFTKATLAANVNNWNVATLTPSTHIYIFTNQATTITMHVYCVRAMGETNFHLNVSAVSLDNDGHSIHNYSTFTITSADFDNYSPGSTYLDYQKVFTIDSRTQSLGNGSLYLIDQDEANLAYPSITAYPVYASPPVASLPFTYITNQGTFDQFSSAFASNSFNYSTAPSHLNLNSTLILPSDSQPVLTVGNSIYSPNGNNRLTLQTDGNLVIYKKNAAGVETAVWFTNTQGKASASLYLQSAGNLVIYPANATPTSHPANSSIWGSNIYSTAGLGTGTHVYYRLYDDGNLVGYWPNYLSYYGLVYIIIDASDTDTNSSTHMGTLSHTLWSPVMQQALGSQYTTIPL